MVHLSALFIYPVKSLRGISVRVADLDALGLVNDRRFMIVDQSGHFLSQRTLPRMALIATELSTTDLILRSSACSGCQIPLHEGTGTEVQEVEVSVWKHDRLKAEDCGASASAWLSDFLGVACRLVRIGKAFARPHFTPRSLNEHRLSFVDGCPMLLVSEASLDGLNDRLLASGEETIPMNRFRPNLVISGCAEFEEDSWPRLKIGSATFHAGGPCDRCVVTTTDQSTGERGPEPLRTMARYRRDPVVSTRINFGQNLIHQTHAGSLYVGDVVSVLR